MNLINENVEIIGLDHRLVTSVNVSGFDKEGSILYTEIPRNSFGKPITFLSGNVYNVVCQVRDKICFFKVTYDSMVKHDGEAAYKFDFFDFSVTENIRSEKRNNIEQEAVISDFSSVGTAVVLDISSSGLKIEVDKVISSEFVEVFFDDENIPKRATGKVAWEKEVGDGIYHYGLNLDYK